MELSLSFFLLILCWACLTTGTTQQQQPACEDDPCDISTQFCGWNNEHFDLEIESPFHDDTFSENTSGRSRVEYARIAPTCNEGKLTSHLTCATKTEGCLTFQYQMAKTLLGESIDEGEEEEEEEGGRRDGVKEEEDGGEGGIGEEENGGGRGVEELERQVSALVLLISQDGTKKSIWERHNCFSDQWMPAELSIFSEDSLFLSIEAFRGNSGTNFYMKDVKYATSPCSESRPYIRYLKYPGNGARLLSSVSERIKRQGSSSTTGGSSSETTESSTTTVGNTTTPESSTATVGNTTTPESSTATVGNTTTPESSTATVGNTTTPESSTTTVGSTTTPESSTTTVENATTPKSSTTTVAHTTTNTVTNKTSSPTTITTTTITTSSITSFTSTPTFTNITTAEAQPAVSTTTIAIAAGTAAGFVVLVIAIVFLVFVWRRRLYCFKRGDDGHKASDAGAKASRSNREAYDMWDLNQQPAVLVGTVNAGFDPESPETAPSMKAETAQNLSTKSGTNQDGEESEVYAKVNKHKHPVRHDYTNVPQNTALTTQMEQVFFTSKVVKAKQQRKDNSDLKPDKPNFTKAGREESRLNNAEEGRSIGDHKETARKDKTVDGEVDDKSQLVHSDNRKPTQTKKTPLLPHDTTLLNSVVRKGYQVLPNVDKDDKVHRDDANQAMAKQSGRQVKIGPPVAKKPQFAVKPLATGNLKRPVLPADPKQPLVMSLAVGDHKTIMQNEENDKREQGRANKIALLPPTQGPLNTDAKTGHFQEHTEKSQQEKTKELDVNGHNTINATQQCNEGNPESKASETYTIDRVSGVINEEGHFYFILDKEPGDSADHGRSNMYFNKNQETPQERLAPGQGDTGDQSRDSTYYSVPGPITTDAKNVARQESSTSESVDVDHREINARAKRRNQDVYYNIPEPLKKKSATSSGTDSANYSVAKLITEHSSAIRGLGEEERGEQIYNYLNQGDDDEYNHTDRGVRKVEIIDEEYSHIQ